MAHVRSSGAILLTAHSFRYGSDNPTLQCVQRQQAALAGRYAQLGALLHTTRCRHSLLSGCRLRDDQAISLLRDWITALPH